MDAPRTLIEPAELTPHLRDPRWVIVDCRFDLADPDAGRRGYDQGHIPGAVYAHLDNDLSGPRTSASGRHPLPDPQVLAATLGGWGISADSIVVAYDDRSGAMAARLWWLLRWLGHDAVAVLNGGLAAWRQAGLPLDTAPAEPTPARFVAQPRPELIAEADELLSAGDRLRLLDARAAPRFRGEVEPIDPVAGHIPGAVNHPFDRNLDADGRFLPRERLAEALRSALGGAPPAQVVSSCGSGVTACHTLLALEHVGLTGARLYPGSWSEWIRDPSRPVARGE